MKYNIGQIVSCDLYGFCKILATKEIPYQMNTGGKPVPVPVKMDVAEPFDYLVMPYKELLEDNSAWFSGILEVKEDWLTDAAEDFHLFCSREVLNKRVAG